MRIANLQEVSTEGWCGLDAGFFRSRLPGGASRLKLPDPEILRKGRDISADDLRPWARMAGELELLVRQHSIPRRALRKR
jgi:hypothetical protein